MNDKGKQWPDECKEFKDEQTGAAVWQLTDQPCINHNLYFLTSSFMPDERSVIFASFRNGTPNFYQAGFPDGPIRQLTDAKEINSFSGCISGDGKVFYFTKAGAIVALDLGDLTETVLADYPDGKLGEVDISPDGKWLVSAIRLESGHGIVVCAADGKQSSIIYRSEDVLIHPQFHPTDADLIEFAKDPAPRMHTIRRDGSELCCLYQHTNHEYVVHESWLGETGDLVFVYWPYAIKRMKFPKKSIDTISEFNAWHVSSSRDGRLIICDTNHPDIGLQLVDGKSGKRRTICCPQSSNSGSQWKKTRYAEKEDFEAAAKAASTNLDTQLSYMDMKTDTVYGPQWTHPHPSFSPSCRYAAFTSNRTGYSQMYVVEIPDF